ncbi:hypothetical protein ACWF9B_04795 [Streptomyces sp. NPDC055089]
MNPPAGPELTPDGRYVVINHRRWRATDPEIPEDCASRLRHHLMAARRGVAAARRAADAKAETRARTRVNTAKVALGERGDPWWEQSADARRSRWEKGLHDLDLAEAEGDGPTR